MTDRWVLAQEEEPYRDFEPRMGVAIDGLRRITFIDDEHKAYALKANPAATWDNDEDLALDEEVHLTWEQAEAMVNQ